MEMNSDTKKAKNILENSEYTCVLVKGDRIYTSSRRGVAPILCLLDSDEDFEGFSSADKVVGKAVAYLYLLMGIKNIYAKVISHSALEVLMAANAEVYYDQEVEGIRNRTNSGPCPMEACVSDVKTPEEALAAIRKKLAELA